MKKKLFHIIFIFFLQITSLSGSIFSEKGLEIPINPQYFFSIRRNQGRSIGNNTAYTTLEALSYADSFHYFWPFLDIRGHYLDKSEKYAANIGTGFRFAPECLDYILGMNVYYDYRRVRHRDFSQVGIGLELLSCFWNFRVNGYLPIEKTSTLVSSCFFNKYVGGFFILHKKYIDSLKGVDFEIESLINRMCWGDVYLAIGGYYYEGNKCRGGIYGTEYRLSTSFCNRFTINIMATHDSAFKTRVEAQLSWTISLKNLRAEDWIFFQPVRRRELIVTDKRNRWITNF